MAEMDWPVSQVSAKESLAYFSTMQLVVRTSGNPETVIPDLRNAFHDIDPGLPFRQPQTMHDVVADVLVFQRLENWLFGTFAAFAVLLAIVGLYGLVSHEVELSTHNVGVRLALGSTRHAVLATIYRRVGLMLLSGVTVGLVMTWAARKLVAYVIVIDAGKDAGAIIGLAAGLLAAGLLAVAHSGEASGVGRSHGGVAVRVGEEQDDRTFSGRYLWSAHAAQESGVHGPGGAYSCTRYRGQYRDLQQCECSGSAAVCASRPRSGRGDMGNSSQAERNQRRRCPGQLSQLDGTERFL